ncbi:MAG: carboxyvinyl-carboxyphosphonate phosphorylmutase [Pelagibacteraceae bacterium]|nr:carboxyvinyl-carboxyphosphonate phosphorylmutase [Pelagibacteraceae bacterium]PPR10058.1 MAG: 2,3-dimethylmalate lyase [Alphaproteobacteria bacterium MarineAlpha11_Bin1]|tara:strand:+ start:19912 stop:20784 length:873 start_codon:yes stop_codon:yes gene_type:complete
MQSKSPTLAGKLRTTNEFIVAPGVYDMISAKMADRAGFHALYMTGSGTVASHLGLPDAGIATYTDMVSRAARLAGGTQTPLIADADTGYGGLVNVRETVRGYEMAGVSAIQIEDQDFPKKCGHLSGHKLISAEEMVTKIKVALDSRLSEDTLIIARTDARKAIGRDEAMRRSELYIEAGADILFYEAPSDIEEMREIGMLFGNDVALLSNMVNGGVTPVMKPEELGELGYRIAIFPSAGFLATCNALRAVYQSLKRGGDAEDGGVDLFSFAEFNDLMGFEDVIEFEKRYN